MSENVLGNLQQMRRGVVLAGLTLLYGFGLGAAFGAAEDDMKAHLRADADQVFAEVYGGDEAKRDRVTSKAWTYLKRAHLHANGLGTAALALILVLAVLPGTVRFRPLTAVFLGLGALLYALFWMFAGFRAPGLGSTDAAKESLTWLAVPSSGMCILGLLLVLHAVVVQILLRRHDA